MAGISPLIPQINYGAGNIPENWMVLMDPLTGQAMFSVAAPGTVSDPSNAPIGGVTLMAVGTPVAAGRGLIIIATTAGNVAVTLADGSTITVPVSVGFNLLPFAATTVTSGPAGATYYNAK